MKVPEVTKQELLDAIRGGVHDAVWQMITNATSMPCRDFFDTVKDGIEKVWLKLCRLRIIS